MRVASKTFTNAATTILTLGLALGLMYSQVCNIVCASSACPVQAKVEQPTQKKEVGHCHHRETTSKNSQPEPRQPAGPHDCHTHDVVSSLPSSAVIGTDELQFSSQPDVIASFVFASFPLDHLASNLSEQIPLRSLPRIPLRSVLRI